MEDSMSVLTTWERKIIHRIIRSRSPRSIVGDFIHTAKRDPYGTLTVTVPGAAFSVYHEADGTTGRITKHRVRLNQRVLIDRHGAYIRGKNDARLGI
jgi:hypothetical protein